MRFFFCRADVVALDLDSSKFYNTHTPLKCDTNIHTLIHLLMRSILKRILRTRCPVCQTAATTIKRHIAKQVWRWTNLANYTTLINVHLCVLDSTSTALYYSSVASRKELSVSNSEFHTNRWFNIYICHSHLILTSGNSLQYLNERKTVESLQKKGTTTLELLNHLNYFMKWWYSIDDVFTSARKCVLNCLSCSVRLNFIKIISN